MKSSAIIVEEADAPRALALLHALNEKRNNKNENLLNSASTPPSSDEEEIEECPTLNSFYKGRGRCTEVHDKFLGT